MNNICVCKSLITHRLFPIVKYMQENKCAGVEVMLVNL